MSEIYTVLGPLVGGRCYPTVIPQSDGLPVWPAIRYTYISETPDATICGDTGDADIKRVQLDLIATSEPEVRQLRSAVMALMATLDTPAINEFSMSTYDEETRTFRVVMDYTLHTSST